MQVKYMDFKCHHLQTHPQPQRGTAQTLHREGTPGPGNCRQGLEPHVHNEARSTPPHLKPTDNVLVNSEMMHVKDIFHKQVLHFNVTLYIRFSFGFPKDFLSCAKNPACTLSLRFSKSFLLCWRK